MNTLARIFGIGATLLIIIGAFLFNGGHLVDLINPAELAGVLLIPLALVTASFDFSGLWECLILITFLLDAQKPSAGTEAIYRYWIKTTYIISALMFLLGTLVTFHWLGAALCVIGAQIASALSSFLYAIVLSELFIRPAICHLRSIQGQPEHKN